FRNGSSRRGREGRVVTGGEPGGNALGPDADAFHRGLERLQSVAWKVVGVLLAGEALFFVIANDARSGAARYLDQRDAGIVEACGADAREVDGFSAFKRNADRIEPLQREAARRSKTL